MGNWSKLDLALPAEIQVASDTMSNIGTQARLALDAAEATAKASEAFLRFQAKPVALAAKTAARQARRVVNDFFSGGGYKLVVHPYLHDVGEGQGIMRHLSYPGAIRHITRKMMDVDDPKRPNFYRTPVEAITIIAGAPSPAIFQETLEVLNGLLSIKELKHAQRRIKQAFELEKNRYARKKGVTLPYWNGFNARNIAQISAAESTLLSQIAMAEGYAKAAESALDRGAKLIAKKKERLKALQTKQQAANALFQAGLQDAGIYALYSSANSSKDLKTDIEASTGAPGHEYSFSAGVCLVGLQGSLKAPKEVLRL